MKTVPSIAYPSRVVPPPRTHKRTQTQHVMISSIFYFKTFRWIVRPPATPDTERTQPLETPLSLPDIVWTLCAYRRASLD